MPRINYVKSARASKFTRKCRNCGHVIEPKEAYKSVDIKTGPVSGYTVYWCSQHNPRPSQMTGNARTSTLYAASESVEDTIASLSDVADLVSALQSASEDAEGVADEYEESASNMEEYFQGSSQVDEIRERGDTIREWADELSNAASDIEGMDFPCSECGDDKDDPRHAEDNEEDFEHAYEPDFQEAIDRAEQALAECPA